MRIGYACLTVGVRNTELKTCMLKSLSEDLLLELIRSNLKSLNNIFDYNIAQNIALFRISSELIPFGSSPHNTLAWWEIYQNQLTALGQKAKDAGIRLSMHPGQYTVLNSPNNDVVKRAIEDLEYHNKILDSLQMGSENKLILHVGGVYGNKKEAISRFATNYEYLSQAVKNRLVIENDDKCYAVSDVLEIGCRLGIPVVFDNLHHTVYPTSELKSTAEWITQCRKTWKQKDGNQKIHYSEQDKQKKPGSHSTTIHAEEFLRFYHSLPNEKPDIMLEVKDKNLSTLKAMNLISDKTKIQTLEAEWGKYKYSVLEKSQENYLKIRNLLKEKSNYPAAEFYSLVEDALTQPETVGGALNAAQHVWGYFKTTADENEKAQFLKLLSEYEQGKLPISRVKNYLFKLAEKYKEEYLLNSYYFI